jgi:hypothetical protein
MTINEIRALAPGQIWKTRAAAIEILRLGKKFIHYKVTKVLGQRRVSAQVSCTEALANYLRVNEAQLVKDPSTTWFSSQAA